MTRKALLAWGAGIAEEPVSYGVENTLATTMPSLRGRRAVKSEDQRQSTVRHRSEPSNARVQRPPPPIECALYRSRGILPKSGHPVVSGHCSRTRWRNETEVECTRYAVVKPDVALDGQAQLLVAVEVLPVIHV